MALPTNIGFGTVTGTFIDQVGGDPLGDKVTFTPTVARWQNVTSTPPMTILREATTVTLDASGAVPAGTTLMATDDAQLNPTEWAYKVHFDKHSTEIPDFYIHVPEGATVDLTTVSPVPASAGVSMVRGAGVPLGGTTGQVLGKVSAAPDDTAWVDVVGLTQPAVEDLTNLDTSVVADGDSVVYDGTAATWRTAPNNSVTTVNGKAGAVSLSASDVGAREATWTPAIADVSGLQSSLDTVSATAVAASEVANSVAAEVDQKVELAGSGGVRLWATRVALPTSGMVEGDLCPIIRGA